MSNCTKCACWKVGKALDAIFSICSPEIKCIFVSFFQSFSFSSFLVITGLFELDLLLFLV